MLKSINELLGYSLQGGRDLIGTVKDFLWDDKTWRIRYFVADTGRWLPDRLVLVSPLSIKDADWQSKRLELALTRSQLETSPSASTHKPVSEERREKAARERSWPLYWIGPPTLAGHTVPLPLPSRDPEYTDSEDTKHDKTEDRHLRSTREVTGYHIEAADGEIGHIEEFIADDLAWSMRYLVIDTRNWLPGRKVLVSPQWIEGIDWARRIVAVDLSKRAIRESPEYDHSRPINREYEIRLYDYYGRPVYWQE